MTPSFPDLSSTAGLVLAGGRSSRFGADKALAPFRGELLLDRAFLPLQCLSAMAISAKTGSVMAEFASEHGKLTVVDDPHGPDGPLAGILAGLDWAHALGYAWLATVPCDAPMLPRDLVAALHAGRGDAPAAFAETVEGAHPLCALWRTDIRTALGSSLQQGRHPSVRGFLTNIGATPVRFDTTAHFANANTREILNELERRS